MLKAFKMAFVRNTERRNSRAAGSDDCLAMLQRVKAMLRKMDAIDMNTFQSSALLELQRAGTITREEVEKMEEIGRRYAKNGRGLWEYARAVIKELPEAERQKEMDEIRKLLERVGFRELFNSAE